MCQNIMGNIDEIPWILPWISMDPAEISEAQRPSRLVAVEELLLLRQMLRKAAFLIGCPKDPKDPKDPKGPVLGETVVKVLVVPIFLATLWYGNYEVEYFNNHIYIYMLANKSK